MVPSEGHIDDVWSLLALERLDVLWREVGELLTRVDLVALSPDVCVRVNLFGLLPDSLVGETLAKCLRLE